MKDQIIIEIPELYAAIIGWLVVYAIIYIGRYLVFKLFIKLLLSGGRESLDKAQNKFAERLAKAMEKKGGE